MESTTEIYIYTFRRMSEQPNAVLKSRSLRAIDIDTSARNRTKFVYNHDRIRLRHQGPLSCANAAHNEKIINDKAFLILKNTRYHNRETGYNRAHWQ